MRAHLAEYGFVTEIFYCQDRGGTAQCRKLEAFVRQRGVFCCVLLSPSRELQHWFSTRSLLSFI